MITYDVNWINKLINKSHFPKVESVELEQKKIGLLRLCVGLIVFVRVFEIIAANYFVDDVISFTSVFTIIIVLLFIIGFYVPITTLGLIVAIRFFDEQGTHTLGSTILIHLLLGMLLANSGQFYSFDGWLLRKKNFQNLFFLPYRAIGSHSNESLTKVYFFVFILYAVISLGAISCHFQDLNWINGLTIKSLLSNSYLSNSYLSFRWLETRFPIFISVLSIFGTIGQSFFQLLMLVLVFHKWGSFFVKWWGLKFFIISLFFINLSYLPHIEIALWFMLFFPINSKSERVSILYDDYCNLCKKTMLFFKKFNFNGRFEFLALSKHKELYEANELTEKEVKTMMVGWYKGKSYKGYDLYFSLFAVNPLFWIFIPLYGLGYYSGLGRIVYNWIADHRYRVFGECELSFDDEIQKVRKLPITPFNKSLITIIYIGFSLLLSLFILLNFPVWGQSIKSRITDNAYYFLKEKFYKAGLEIPNVFNHGDLRVGDNWIVIYRKEEGKNWELTPLVGEDGQRLNYERFDILSFSNHNSDMLYFGLTLEYRKSVLFNSDFKEFHTSGYGAESIRKRIVYDYNRLILNCLVIYKARVYSAESSEAKHWKSNPERHVKRLRFEQMYSFDGETFLAQ